MAGDRSTLARAITLVESLKTNDKTKSMQLLGKSLELTTSDRYPRTFRIGFSGPPGAGKSTFIEALGTTLLNKQTTPFNRFPVPKLAVLTVDPSSVATGGSLLADKTRMTELSVDSRAFVRPSPSGGNLGGVARSTSEAIMLCETAGFPLTFVETVGVGQSEFTVAEMVDLFVLIIPPAGGDELQGLKKGIVEFADIVLVNKADGDLKPAARRIATEYSSALKYIRRRHHNWNPKVMLVSSLTREGIAQFWEQALEFRNKMNVTGELKYARDLQRKSWMWNYLREGVMKAFLTHPMVSKELAATEKEVLEGRLAPGAAAEHLLKLFI